MTAETRHPFAERLSADIAASGLSRTQVAASVGFSEGALKRYLAAGRAVKNAAGSFPPDKVAALAQVLGQDEAEYQRLAGNSVVLRRPDDDALARLEEGQRRLETAVADLTAAIRSVRTLGIPEDLAALAQTEAHVQVGHEVREVLAGRTASPAAVRRSRRAGRPEPQP